MVTGSRDELPAGNALAEINIVRAVVFSSIQFGSNLSTTIVTGTNPPIAIYRPKVNGVAIYYGVPGSTSLGAMYLGEGDLAYVIGNVLHLAKN